MPVRNACELDSALWNPASKLGDCEACPELVRAFTYASKPHAIVKDQGWLETERHEGSPYE